MSGAMRRILAFMLKLLLARNAHAEEWESLVQELAREIAEETITQTMELRTSGGKRVMPLVRSVSGMQNRKTGTAVYCRAT